MRTMFAAAAFAALFALPVQAAPISVDAALAVPAPLEGITQVQYGGRPGAYRAAPRAYTPRAVAPRYVAPRAYAPRAYNPGYARPGAYAVAPRYVAPRAYPGYARPAYVAPRAYPGYARPYRARPYYGRYWRPGYGWGVAAGVVTLGVLSAAAAASYAPPPPGDGYCWYYTDPSQQEGYWNVCE